MVCLTHCVHPFLPAIPVVDIVADPRVRIALGQSVTLTCNVTKANPTAFTYEWTFEDTDTTLSETSETLTLSDIMASQFGTYTCDVTNAAGTGSDTITIEEGGKFNPLH